MNELQDLLVLIKSRFPIVLIESHEQPRVLALLENSTNLDNTRLYTWAVTSGLRRRLRTETVPETPDLMMALRHIDKNVQNGGCVLLDAQPYLQDPIHLRLIREIAPSYSKTPRTACSCARNALFFLLPSANSCYDPLDPSQPISGHFRQVVASRHHPGQRRSGSNCPHIDSPS